MGKMKQTKEIENGVEELKDFYAKEKNARIFLVAEAEGDEKDSAKGCVLVAGGFPYIMAIVARGLVDVCRQIPPEKVPRVLMALTMTVMTKLDSSDKERGEHEAGDWDGFDK